MAHFQADTAFWLRPRGTSPMHVTAAELGDDTAHCVVLAATKCGGSCDVIRKIVLIELGRFAKSATALQQFCACVTRGRPVRASI